MVIKNTVNLSTCEICSADVPPGHGFYLPESTERICKECFFQARKNNMNNQPGMKHRI